VQYFERQGESRLSVKHQIATHILEMFNRGENRALMLANLAIEKAERDLLAEQEIREAKPGGMLKQQEQHTAGLRTVRGLSGAVERIMLRGKNCS
jgi:hypothetical protein